MRLWQKHPLSLTGQKEQRVAPFPLALLHWEKRVTAAVQISLQECTGEGIHLLSNGTVRGCWHLNFVLDGEVAGSSANVPWQL